MLPALVGGMMMAVGGVWLPDLQLEDTVIWPNGASAFVQFRADGTINTTDGAVGHTIIGNWLLGGLSSDYQFRMTPTSGTFQRGTVNAWVGAGEMWAAECSRQNFGGAFAHCSGLLECRRASDLTVIASCTVDLSAAIETQ